MARLSPKHLLVMLLAAFLAAGFSLSTAQAGVMSAMMAGGMTMAADAGMGAGGAMQGDCTACLKDMGDNGSLKQCPSVCIAPVLAVLPQDFAVTMALRPKQPLAQSTPFLHGRSSPPDPFPPRPGA
ncbi:hypothetical protein [Mesorhizobium sp. BR1-1-2]|uniref:hypothetical protein n=1 Tax=Mesorhizobium sp. BR1-1-2 TaxID=2876652 RepID=UPI001CCF98A6|nr:hypothetical protein [Mesorhizobium sp. BR1-1-2]MBZ9963116.1 hypothetical protein [Mesorhizobium sp. BR1-1-2]